MQVRLGIGVTLGWIEALRSLSVWLACLCVFVAEHTQWLPIEAVLH